MNQQREQPTNEPSLLLDRDENEMVFAALGHRRIVSCFFIHRYPRRFNMWYNRLKLLQWRKYILLIRILTNGVNLKLELCVLWRTTWGNLTTSDYWRWLLVQYDFKYKMLLYIVGQRIYNSLGTGVVQSVYLFKGSTSFSSFSWRCKWCHFKISMALSVKPTCVAMCILSIYVCSMH